MAIVDPEKDMTIYKYEPNTNTDAFEQFNILFADGYTSSGYTEWEIADDMRDRMIADQTEDPQYWQHGDVNNSKIIKRVITTTVITERGDWEEA